MQKHHFHLFIVTLLFLGYLPPAAAEGEAEIVSLSGKGARKDPGSRWQKAIIHATIKPGGYVKTLGASQMGILLSDRSQLRLNQNSLMQIKTIAATEEWQQTQLELKAGRAWSNARPLAASRDDDNMPPITMNTPTATLSIRGTIWLVDVDAQGKTQLVVLSGRVDMASKLGQVSVGSGEAAVVERGRAPVKFQLTNPADRVQWVTAWRPAPDRWLNPQQQRRQSVVIALLKQQDYAAAMARLRPLARSALSAALLLADLHIYLGETPQAIRLLAPFSRQGRGDAVASALLGHALLIADQRDRLHALLDKARQQHPEALELQLLAGKLALFEGQETPARQAYTAAINQHPDSPRGWLGLGVIAAEREEQRKARTALHRSLQREADFPPAQAELATLETRAGNLHLAEQLFDDLLSRQPEDFIALTGQGLLRLKQGRPQEALQDFLRSGLIEPHYARGWFYSGVAFYQLGESTHALNAFRQAALQDDKDPLPHLLQSRIQGDALEYGQSIRSAQRAIQLMPNLKSINQLANDQKGSANLGRSLADFGLEDWANHHAISSYSPYWAGSHLFMADRYTGLFNKNSELFSGFLTDPTAFGASNRFSHLVLSPGHYGRLDLLQENEDWRESTADLTLNGYSLLPLPFAYFVSGDLAHFTARDHKESGEGENLTLGLGSRLGEHLSAFAYAAETRIDSDARTEHLQRDRNEQHAGFNYKLGPRNQLWLKAGRGDENDHWQGPHIPGKAKRYSARVVQEDQQFRHSLTIGKGNLLSWGLEQARQVKHTDRHIPLNNNVVDQKQQRRLTSIDTYLSLTGQPISQLTIQADLFWQQTQLRQKELDLINRSFAVLDRTIKRQLHELNPRLGLKYELTPAHSLTLAGQSWRRPASVNTLSQVDTLGIAVNDWLVSAGGKYQQARLQFDSRWGENRFLRLYAAREKIDNLSFAEPVWNLDPGLKNLQDLQNKFDVFGVDDPYENNPRFLQGEVNSLGLAWNQLLSQRQSIAIHLDYSEHQQTGSRQGLKIPYLPDFKARLSSQWALPHRWLLGATATYRSARFEDEDNREPLQKGWNLGFTTHWQSPDKRLQFQATLDNILSHANAGIDSEPHVSGKLSWLF
jgi:Flp pilus assembly protein TadD